MIWWWYLHDSSTHYNGTFISLHALHVWQALYSNWNRFLQQHVTNHNRKRDCTLKKQTSIYFSAVLPTSKRIIKCTNKTLNANMSLTVSNQTQQDNMRILYFLWDKETKLRSTEKFLFYTTSSNSTRMTTFILFSKQVSSSQSWHKGERTTSKCILLSPL